MAKQTTANKKATENALSLDEQYLQIRNSPGWTDTLLGDLVYIHSGGKSRDFFKLDEKTKASVLEKLSKKPVG